MIVDTSAIVAIFLEEPDWTVLYDKLLGSRAVGIGVPTIVETGIVLSARLARDSRPLVDRFLLEASIVPIPFSDVHHHAAIDAWQRYGRGRHPASLNFGDCLTYATARVAGEPLLCVGDDFGRTDLLLA